jgi:hypothetical protein
MHAAACSLTAMTWRPRFPRLGVAARCQGRTCCWEERPAECVACVCVALPRGVCRRYHALGWLQYAYIQQGAISRAATQYRRVQVRGVPEPHIHTESQGVCAGTRTCFGQRLATGRQGQGMPGRPPTSRVSKATAHDPPFRRSLPACPPPQSVAVSRNLTAGYGQALYLSYSYLQLGSYGAVGAVGLRSDRDNATSMLPPPLPGQSPMVRIGVQICTQYGLYGLVWS